LTFQPEQKAIGELFQERTPQVVPRYQRSYAWEKEEISDFIKDIRPLAEARKAGDVPESHFFGGIVTVDTKTPGKKKILRYDVIDGQQRLATFYLLLSAVVHGYRAIADITEGETADLATDLYDVTRHDYLIYEEVADKKVEKARLALSRRDAQFFEELAAGNDPTPGRPSHELLQDAYSRLYAEFVSQAVNEAANSPSAGLEMLNAVKEAVAEDCEVIHIIAGKKREAYRLFTVLNDRGRDLAEGDLLRAFSLELLEGHESKQESIEAMWDEILSDSAQKTDSFLRDYYASFTGERSPSSDLFDRFAETFLPEMGSLSVPQADEVVNRIKSMLEEYRAHVLLRDGAWPFEPTSTGAWERDRLKRLITILGRSTTIPLLMAAYRCKGEGFLVDLVQFVERMDFRYLVVGGHAGSLGERYYRQAKAIRDDPPSFAISTLRDDIEPFVAARASDETFAAALPSRVRYGSAPQNRRLKHLLTTLNDYLPVLNGGAKPNMTSVWDMDAISIEHVYAQHAKAECQDN
jgi:hypothetical protein